MTKHTINFETRIKILYRLQEVGKKADGGFYEYAKGFDDGKIAQEFKCTNANVAYVRRKALGNLRDNPRESRYRLEELASRFQIILQLADDLANAVYQPVLNDKKLKRIAGQIKAFVKENS